MEKKMETTIMLGLNLGEHGKSHGNYYNHIQGVLKFPE